MLLIQNLLDQMGRFDKFQNTNCSYILIMIFFCQVLGSERLEIALAEESKYLIWDYYTDYS